MSEQDRDNARDAAFIAMERRKLERLQDSQEAADRNFKEGLRAAYRDATTKDALATEIVRAARAANAGPRVDIRAGEGFEGI